MKKNIALCLLGLTMGVSSIVLELPSLFTALLAVGGVGLMVWSVRYKIKREVRKQKMIPIA